MATRVEQSSEVTPQGISYAGALRKTVMDANKENVEINLGEKTNNQSTVDEFPQIVSKPTRNRTPVRERRQRSRRRPAPVEREKSAERRSSQGEEEPEVVQEEVKFVEAPIPKVNPWTKKLAVIENDVIPEKNYVIEENDEEGEFYFIF